MSRAFADPQVKAAFDGFDPAVRTDALWLRELIFDTAEATEGVGEITETLRWGQPAYLPVRPRTGTTVRIGAAGAPGQLGMFVHCQTSLIDSYRRYYGGDLVLDGNRAVVLTAGQRAPAEMLGHCIAMALTYHLRGR